MIGIVLRRRSSTPAMLYLYGLIVLRHEHVSEKPGKYVRIGPGKKQASFADMLATLRRESLEKTRETILFDADLPPGVEELIKPFELLLESAA